jgi:PAS domain S-box-containing protein
MIKTILFIEDDEVDRMSLERKIKKSNQFNFFSAPSVFKATEILSSNQIDVIVTDYNLGDGVGIDFIKKYLDIPVIIITGTNDIELAVTAMKEGAYDFLVKDFDRTYLKMIELSCQQAIKRKNQELFLLKITQAVEQSPGLVLITDINGVIEYANPKLTELTGFTKDDLIGASVNIFKSGYHTSDFYQKMWKTIISGHKWTGELYNKTKLGSLYWEFASIAPIKNKEGRITHFVKVAENITELKKAEQEKIKAEKLQSVLEMAGTVSHELNQPLQIILGYSELLKEKLAENDKFKKQLQHIINNINRIVEITEKIKNITEYKTKHYLDNTNIIDIH